MSGSRPTGAPFWGESIGIQDTYTIGGYDLNSLEFAGPLQSRSWDVKYGRGTGSPPVMSSGDEALVGCYGPRYLMAGDVANVSWVIVLGAGSSGTLQVNAGLNPDYDNDTSGLTENLGSHAVTGAATLVLPCLSVSVADILAADIAGAEPQCRIRCTAGSVKLAQVKLRVWPPGGPIGGWTAGAPSDSQEFGPILLEFEDLGLVGPDVSDLDAAAAWSGAWAGFHSAYTSPSGPIVAIDHSSDGALELGEGTGLVNLITLPPDPGYVGTMIYGREAVAVLAPPGWELALATTPLPGLTDGVDYIIPPDQVGTYRQDYTGTLAWIHDTCKIVATYELTGTSGYLSSTGLTYGAFTLDAFDWTVTPATAETGTTITGADGTYTFGVDAAGNDAWQVVAGHSMQTSEPPFVDQGVFIDTFRIYLGDGTPLGEDFEPTKYVVTVPAGNLWKPDSSLTPPPPATLVIPLRQVQRNDGLAASGARRARPSSRQFSNRPRGYL